MEKITFENNVTKANAETFNTMQDNIENAINDSTITLDDEVSTSSTNGVENQAITNYVDDKILDEYSTDSTKTYSCDYINNNSSGNEIYSTDEIKTNKVWIDGKPIYRKTYVFSNLTASARTIDITNLNIDTFLPYEAFGTWPNGGAVNWPYYISNTDNGRIYRTSPTQVNINYTFPDYNSRGLIVTLYYTKTTD